MKFQVQDCRVKILLISLLSRFSLILFEDKLLNTYYKPTSFQPKLLTEMNNT